MRSLHPAPKATRGAKQFPIWDFGRSIDQAIGRKGDAFRNLEICQRLSKSSGRCRSANAYGERKTGECTKRNCGRGTRCRRRRSRVGDEVDPEPSPPLLPICQINANRSPGEPHIPGMPKLVLPDKNRPSKKGGHLPHSGAVSVEFGVSRGRDDHERFAVGSLRITGFFLARTVIASHF